MLDAVLIGAVIAILVAINALYVAAEFATVAVRRSRLQQLAAEGNRLAGRLLETVGDSQKLDRYIAACQLGITASSLVLGAYGQRSVAAALAPALAALGGMAMPVAQSISATGVLLALTVLQVVLGELFPKSVAIQYREQVATAVVLPMRWSVALFRPFIWLFNGSANALLQLLNLEPGGGHAHVHSPNEIDLLVQEAEHGGLVEPDERQLVHNAFRFRAQTARRVMTPRNRMVAAPEGTTGPALIELALNSGNSRIPLYRGTIDNVVGFVHLKDLFRLQLEQRPLAPGDVRSLIHVPASLLVADLWRELNARQSYLAIVLDEYGGTAGLVTMADLMEEVFGELRDEFDEDAPLVKAMDREGRLHLRGDVRVDDANEFLGFDLPTDLADTLGGLAMSALGRIPEPGDEVTSLHPHLVLRVEAMDGLAVAEVSLRSLNGPLPSVAGWSPP